MLFLLINILPILFFVVASFYSIVGFGGGSTYTALLIMSGVSYALVPIIGLSCNLIVVISNTIRYFKNNLINYQLIAPFVLTSTFGAFLGGYIKIPKELFLSFLGFALLFAGFSMVFSKFIKKQDYEPKTTKPPFVLSAFIGFGIGVIAGITGIGGGIYLAPMLYFMRWGEAKHIASTASLFILVNSIAGLIGQFSKNGFDVIDDGNLWLFVGVCVGVLIGGQIGNFIGVKKASNQNLMVITGILIIFVSLVVLNRAFSLFN